MSAFTQQRISSEVSILSGSLLFQWEECELNNHSLIADEEGRREKITIEDQQVSGENGRKKTTNIGNNGIDNDDDDNDGGDKDGKKTSYTRQDTNISYSVKRIPALVKRDFVGLAVIGHEPLWSRGYPLISPIWCSPVFEP